MKSIIWKYITLKSVPENTRTFKEFNHSTGKCSKFNLDRISINAKTYNNSLEYTKYLDENNSSLVAVLKGELEYELEKRVLKKLLSIDTEILPPKRRFSFLHSLFNYKPKVIITRLPELYSAINRGYYSVHSNCRKDPEFIIIHPKTLKSFEKSTSYDYVNDTSMFGFEYVGHLNNLRIITNPHMPEELMLMCAFNTSSNQSGLVAIESKSTIDKISNDEYEQTILRTTFGCDFLGDGEKMYLKIPITYNDDSLWTHIKFRLKSLFKYKK